MHTKIACFVLLSSVIACGSSGSGGGNSGGTTATGGTTSSGGGSGGTAPSGGGSGGGGGTVPGGGGSGGGSGGTAPGGGGSGGTTPGGGGSGGATSGLAACNDLCQKASSLCSATVTDCQSGCSQAYQQFPNCASEIDATFLCADTRPLTDFHCGTNGTPQLNAGVCQAEVDALTACVT